MKTKAVLFFLIVAFSCIGVDTLNDPIDTVKGNTIVFEDVEDNLLALSVNESYQVEATYYDPYGIERDRLLVWESSDNEVATVVNGLITAHTPGSVMILASFESASLAIQLTVVGDVSAVASVQIDMPSSSSLAVGQTLQLSATVRNIEGSVLQDKTIEWFTENSSLLSVSTTGQVTGVGNGSVEVHAKSEDVKSNSLFFTVGTATQRIGQFVSAGGYQAKGTAVLKSENNQLLLELKSDFVTSFALGTYVYLANSTSGSQVKSGGFEVAQITTNGAKTFNISNLQPSITLQQYKYVVILCKPASVSFGYAELK